MKNIKFPICAASLFILMSCVDLNLNPLSEGSSENWYSSQAEIEMSLNDFYRKEFFPIDDMMWGDDVTARNSTSAINNGTLTSEDWTIASRWENYYKGIARALRIIKNMDRARAMGVSENDITQYEGEAYFYLGYAYGMLAFHWGDAILDKEGMSLDEAYTASRSPRLMCWLTVTNALTRLRSACRILIRVSNAPQKVPLMRLRQGLLFIMKITLWPLPPPRVVWI